MFSIVINVIQNLQKRVLSAGIDYGLVYGFIECLLSLWIDYLGHCTDPPLPIPSFLTEHQGRRLSLLHHLTPLQTSISPYTAQHSEQCSLRYRA